MNLEYWWWTLGIPAWFGWVQCCTYMCGSGSSAYFEYDCCAPDCLRWEFRPDLTA